MAERVQDLIIGAGVIGVNCAHALALEGREVVMVDQGAVCSGCSHGNAGWITPCHSLPIPGPGLVLKSLRWMLRGDSPLYIKPTLRPSLWKWLWRFYRHCNHQAELNGLKAMAELNSHVVPLTRELVQQQKLDCEFEQRGILFVFGTEAGLEKGIEECRLLIEHGIAGEVLSHDQVRQREPALTESIVGGVSYPDDCDCVPDLFVKQLADRLPSLGVRIRTETAVNGFTLAEKRVETVVTSAGTFRPENVILAAGAWTLPLAKRLGISLSMQPGKGYSITLKRQAGIPNSPINLAEAKVAVTPWRDKVRLAGTMEFAGFQLQINQRRVAAILRAARSWLPELQAERAENVWSGMRPVTSDGLPIIGRSSRLNNVILATGHGMLGLTQSVVTGRLVTDLLLGRTGLIDLRPFSPDR
jgi:D-amino-acid dehydrogenase